MASVSSVHKFTSSQFKIILVIAASSIFYLTTRPEKSPVVRTAVGDVQGLVLSTSRNDRRYYLYRGVPFAEPPIGNLRFESPRPVKRWSGILDATTEAPVCKGFELFFTHRIQGQESCLFLDIYSPEIFPEDHAPKKLLPVIAHIHGGAFQSGGNMFDGQYFMDKDIILVNIQYRLGVFGFLSTKDEVIKGNMGLKDQVMALKWIQENIVNFGGDPNQVTIFGESAGGASVHLMMLSPMAKGLFHRGITMNVAGTSDVWHFKQDVLITKNSVAEYFNCSTKSEEFAQCLRKVDEDSLASYNLNILGENKYNNENGMGPVIENFNGPDAFLTENPWKLLEDGKIASKVPWMVGANSNEGLIFLGMYLKFIKTAKDMVVDKIWDETIPDLLFYNGKERPDASRKIKEHLSEGGDLSALNETETIQKLSTMITEKLFFKSLVDTTKLHQNLHPVYMYLFTYEGFMTIFDIIRYPSPKSWIPPELTISLKLIRDLFYKLVLRLPQERFGMSHGDDSLLMFSVPKFRSALLIDTFDFEMSQLLIKTLADFATFEKPRFQGLEWPALNSSNGLECMELNTGKPRILQDPFKTRLQFWDDLKLPHA